MTLDEAHELRGGELLTDEWREAPLLVLGPPYSDFDSRWVTSQWRLPVLNLDSGRRESWPNGRLDELSRW